MMREIGNFSDQDRDIPVLRARGGGEKVVQESMLQRSTRFIASLPPPASPRPVLRDHREAAWAGSAIWLVMVVAGPAPAVENKPDPRARSVIFGEESLVDVLELRRQTRRMPAEERYEHLLAAVFPPGQSAVRIDIDFTPTHPSPPVIAELGIEEDRASREFESNPVRTQLGASLVSPAIDLVEAAKRSGKLDELRRLVASSTSNQPLESKSRLALLALIAIADDDFEAAREGLAHLRQLAANEPVVHAERGPEAVAMWIGSQEPQTRDAARDLAFLVYEQARNNQGPRSERSHRQTYALKHSLQWLADQVSGDSSSAEPLAHWVRVSRMTAETCGKGFPLARWETRAGQVQHITGHDHDYLYFVSPLKGDFEVEGDFTTFGYRDIHLAVGSVWAGPGYDLKACLTGSFRRDQPALPIDPPLTRMFDWMRVRAVVRDGIRTTYINGRKVFEAPHPGNGDPWLAIHSAWYANGAVRNLRIGGEPEVPAEIEMAATPQLPGWLPYFDETAGSSDSDWRLEQSPQGPISPTVLIGRRRPDLSGSRQESLLRYHRPMLEDGVISYEFFYVPGEVAVHPALDRLCLLLRSEGVGVHWLTDGKFDSTSLDPANSVSAVGERGGRPPPLRGNEWNRVQLALHGDQVELRLNEELVLSRELEPTNQRAFGLFHYADQTEARVRNLRWRGAWPRELPPPAQQQLADDGLEQVLGDPEKLPVVFEHNFASGLPLDRFLLMGAGWENDIEHISAGLRMTRQGGDYARYSIAPQLTLAGAFDITVAFEDLRTSVATGGEGNIQLLAALEDERSTECRVYRKHYLFTSGKIEQLVQAAVFQRRDGKTDYSYPASPAEESVSGRMRLARRGARMYFLYAQDASPEFRLIHSQEVTTAPTRTAGVRLVLESHKPGGEAEVVWKSIVVRAESVSGPIARPARTVAQLDDERRQLPAKATYDFSRHSTPTAFNFWGPAERFTWDGEGMMVEAPGASQWTAAGVTSKVSLEGDFDVSLDLEVLHMDTPPAKSEAATYLQTEFSDEGRTAIEIKFAGAPGGSRAVEMQLNTRRPDGSINYQELSTRELDGVSQLRLARRGEIVYLIFQAAADAPSHVLSRAEVGTAPVPATCLRALVHTGGEGRKSVVRFRKLRIDAERILGQAPVAEGE